MLTLFFVAFGLGLIFNITPGAVFTETVRHGLRGGFRPALAVQIGSLAGDASWAILGLTGMGFALQWEALRWPMGLLSALYLSYLGWDSWKAARTVHEVDLSPSEASGERSALHSGVLLSLTNPQNLAYWGAISSALAAFGIAEPQVEHYATFFAGLMSASLLWCFVCAALVARLLGQVGTRWARFTYRLCAVALLTLALNTLRDLVLPSTAGTPPTAPAAAAAELH